MNTLWNELHALFEHDDGNLYDIWLTNLDPRAVTHIYALLHAAAEAIPHNPTFWDKQRDQARSLDSVPNAAQLVVDDEAEPFHFLVQGIAVGQVTLPDVGVFVFPDMIALDYRKGHEWQPATLEALFNLLTQIRRSEPTAHITLPDMVLPAVRQQFEQALVRHLAQDPQQDLDRSAVRFCGQRPTACYP